MSDIDELIEDLDERIARINNSKTVRAAEKLIEKREKLQRARAALLGAGPKLTSGSGGNRMTQSHVVSYMGQQDLGHIFTVEEIASGLGTTVEVVRGHLNRGKGERFLSPERGKWALRDPEHGINDEDDLDADD